MSRRVRNILVGLSILIAAAALWLWLRNFDVTLDEFSTLFAQLQWWPIIPLFGLLAGHVALSSWRWAMIEVAIGGQQPRFSHAFTTGAFALGLGTILPSPIVNVACRSLANRFNGTSSLRGAISGGIDQAADFAVVLLLAAPAVIAVFYHKPIIFLWGTITMVFVGMFGLLAMPAIMRLFHFPVRFGSWAFIALCTDRPFLLKIYGISLLRICNLILMNIAIQAATGAVAISAVIVSVPLVMLATSVTMLPGGFGVAEWSFSGVFAGFGIDQQSIVFFVLANRIILTSLSIILAVLTLLAVTARMFQAKSMHRESVDETATLSH